MASNNKRVQFDIIAKDRTKAVFNAVAGGLGTIRRVVFSFKTALAGLVGAGGLALMVKQSLDTTDRLGKLSKQLGITTQNLGSMKLAADLGGTSLETFAKGARRAGRNAFDFIVKGTGEAAEAFRALGISQEDLKPILNDYMAILGLVADRMNELPDGALKATLAAKILGERAVELVPALAGGSAELEKYRKEAERFGLALSGDAVKGVEAANDAMTRLKAVFQGARDNLVAALAPALERLVNYLTNRLANAINASGGSVDEWARGVANSFISAAASAIRSVGEMAGWVLDKVDEVKRFFGLGAPDLNAELDETRRKLNGLIALREQARQNIGSGGLIQGMRDALGVDQRAIDDYSKQIDQLIDKMAKLMVAIDDTSSETPLADRIREGAEQAAQFVESFRIAARKAGNDFDEITIDHVKRVTDAITKTTTAAKSVLLKFIDEARDRWGQIEQAAVNTITNLEDVWVNFARTGKISFKSMIDSMIADLARFVWRQHVSLGLAQGLAGSGGFLQSIFGGFRASGGPVQRGKAYVVGEEGPEIFKPDASGRIVAANDTQRALAMGGGGGTIVQIIDKRGSDAPAVQTRRSRGSDGRELIEVFIQAAAQDVARHGPLGQAMEANYAVRRRGY